VTHPLRVLQSATGPHPNRNPYAILLVDCLRAEGAKVDYFSWRNGLLGRYDVFHSHWPEAGLTGPSRIKNLARQCLFLLLLLRLRLTRTPLVQTAHNLHLPSGISRREHGLLSLAQVWTTLWIRINDSTSMAEGIPFETIPHGHYREWYCRYPKAEPVPGQASFVGLVRRYKNVPHLIRAFRDVPGADLSLLIAGHPSTPELADEVRHAAEADPRVNIQLTTLTDPEMVMAITQAELVVLPYRGMHNSGQVLTVLSLDRPVLVPSTEVNERLSAEVGPGWVRTYEDELEASDLAAALSPTSDAQPTGRPDLSARDWRTSAALHLAAYRRAIELAHRRRGT
jgi:beta-1,4-mannosyltransferase